MLQGQEAQTRSRTLPVPLLFSPNLCRSSACSIDALLCYVVRASCKAHSHSREGAGQNGCSGEASF